MKRLIVVPIVAMALGFTASPAAATPGDCPGPPGQTFSVTAKIPGISAAEVAQSFGYKSPGQAVKECAQP